MRGCSLDTTSDPKTVGLELSVGRWVSNGPQTSAHADAIHAAAVHAIKTDLAARFSAGTTSSTAGTHRAVAAPLRRGLLPPAGGFGPCGAQVLDLLQAVGIRSF